MEEGKKQLTMARHVIYIYESVNAQGRTCSWESKSRLRMKSHKDDGKSNERECNERE